MRCIATALTLAILSLFVPVHAAAQTAAVTRTRALGAAPVTPAPVSISGIVVTLAGQPLGNTTLRARNLLTGRIVGPRSTTTSSGQFSLVGLDPGDYVLEVVDAAGQILGTSSFIYAAAGTTVVATVTATRSSEVNTVTGFAATLTTTAAQSVRYAAVAAGVAGMVAPGGVATASPAR
jgi:hypothetical protein